MINFKNEYQNDIESLIPMEDVLIPLNDIMKYKDFLKNFKGTYLLVSIDNINTVLYGGKTDNNIFDRWIKETINGYDSAHLFLSDHLDICKEKITNNKLSIYALSMYLAISEENREKYFLKLFRINHQKLNAAFEKYMITKYMPIYNTEYIRDTKTYKLLDTLEIDSKNKKAEEEIREILERGYYIPSKNDNVTNSSEESNTVEIIYDDNNVKKDINDKMRINASEFEKNNVGDVSSAMKKGCLIIKHSIRKYDNNMQLFIHRYLIEKLENEYKSHGKNIHDFIVIRDPEDPNCGTYTFNSKKINITTRTSDTSKRNFRTFFETIDKFVQCEFRIENVFKTVFIETFGEDYNSALQHKVVFFEDKKFNNVV